MTHLELITLNYLLNALWQIPVIFLVATLAARLTRSAGPHIQHRIWVAALLLEVALPACAFAPALRNLFLSLFQHNSGHVTTQVTVLNATVAHSNSRLVATIALAALIAYIAVLSYLAARLLYRLHRTRALRRTAQPITLTRQPLTSWQRCARIFGVHDAQLATCTAIAGPSTIGIRNRIVLLPPTLLTDLPHEDLAAALAHEFAHMRRRDFAKNLLYELIALPIAWHPFFWLTRLRIAESREMVCDELAAQMTHGATRYARSLLRLAASFSRPAPASTFHAIGILDANALERRVMTLNRKRTLAAASRRTSIAVAVLLGAATCASAMSLRLEIPAHAIAAPPIVAAAQDSNGRVQIGGGVAAGQIISKVNPIYPPIAKAAGVGGSVVLHAVIGKDGTVRQLAVLSGPSMLVGSAIDAVRQWVYQPYLLNGEPVEVDTTVTVNYSPANSASQQSPDSPSSANNTDADAYHISGPDDGVYNVGGSVRPPVATFTADPQYTESARKAKLSGNVVVGLIVDAAGQPQNVHIERGLGNDLDEKAIEAVQQYRFKPATRDGEPVPVNLKVEVNFQIF